MQELQFVQDFCGQAPDLTRLLLTGPGTDFDNWELESRTNIGSLYY